MKRPLFVIAGGFVLGEVLGLQERFAVIMILAFVFTALILLIFTGKRDEPQSGSVTGYIKTTMGKRPVILSLLLLFLISGFIRGNAEKRICEREAGLCLDGVKAEVCGKVERIREGNDRLEVLIRPERGSPEGELRYLLVYTDGKDKSYEKELSPGMKVLFRGKYSESDTATNPGQFDYRAYYRAQKLTYRFFADDGVILNRNGSLYDKCTYFLFRLRGHFADVIGQIAEDEDAGVLRSLLLGDKSGLDERIRGLYQKMGISHLLAISGLHLSLISAAVYGILRRTGMGFGPAGLIGGLILFCYCIMSGASISSLRALIMVLLSYLAAWKGRTYDLLSGLGVAAILLFMDSPYQLTQPGPLLSFTAILGIAAVSESGAKALGCSFAIQMAAAPVILCNFFRFPLYGVFINLFVLPLSGLVIASGAAGIAAGMVSLSLGRFFIGMAHYILLWYDFICSAFEPLPGSSLLIGEPAAVQTGIYYAALLTLWYKNKRFRTGKGLLVAAPLLLLLFPLPVRNCNILFMDVGQGDGILIRSEAGVILVDGGSSSVNDLYEKRLEPCLESLAVSEIDYAIVSHGHSDHISGLSMLFEPESEVYVKNLILPAAGRGDEVYDHLTERAQNAGTEVIMMEGGDTLDFGKMRLSCLYPGDSFGHPDADANEHSLVLRLDYGDFSMLLGGDMTSNGEAAILSESQLRQHLSGIEVLKVAHHGSSTSSSLPWLDAVSPVWAVISYGKNNIYHHPSEETIDALNDRDIKIYETALDGAISLWTDGKSIRWDTFTPRDTPSF